MFFHIVVMPSINISVSENLYLSLFHLEFIWSLISSEELGYFVFKIVEQLSHHPHLHLLNLESKF